MKKNMATADRIIRILVVIIAGILVFTGVVSGTLAIIVGIVAAVFLLTSLVGFCPLYTILGISTCKRKR